MSRAGRIRNSGAIPERRHDAFLLALLLALCLNITFFVVQALIPKLAYLLQALGPEPAAAVQPEEESYPFVLVDPALLEEEPDPLQTAEAEANLSRRARQTEATPDLPEQFARITEGIDDILTAPEGNPGPAVSYQQSPGEQTTDQSAQPEETPAEQQEQAEPQEATEARESAETPREVEPNEAPPEEAASEELAQETPEQPPLEPLPEIAPEMPPPPPETVPDPQENPEPPADATPDPDPEPDPRPDETPPEETITEAPEPQPEDAPDPASEIIDLAMLPATNEGFFDPETRRLEELARQRQQYPQEVPRRPQPTEFGEPVERPLQQPVPEQQPTARRERRNRPQPTFRKIGGASPSAPSATGGAPRRRNENSAVRLLDADASMALLAHRYGPYMEKLARQLQDSLFRQMILSPTSYSRGQVKVRFGISPDGTLTYYTTIFPNDGSMDLERILSERMLREAAPFDPLTQEMQQDENFQRMTVIVNLY